MTRRHVLIATLALCAACAALSAVSTAPDAEPDAIIDKSSTHCDSSKQQCDESAAPAEEPEFDERTVVEALPQACSLLRAQEGDSLWLLFNATFASGPHAGKLFESTPSQRPIQYAVGSSRLIVGIRRAFRGMCLGEEREITIPSALAYGATGVPDHKPPIPPHTAVRFRFRCIRINGWDGTRLEQPAAHDLHTPIGYTPPKYCTYALPAGGEVSIECRVANFGRNEAPNVNTALEAEGRLVVPQEPNFGCKGALHCGAAGAGAAACEGAVVLVRRGKCSFFEKYREVAAAGAKALVIADSQPLGEAGLIGLTKGGNAGTDDKEACETGAAAPIAVAISLEDGEVLESAALTAKAAMLPLVGFKISAQYHHADAFKVLGMERDVKIALAANAKAGHGDCGPAPRAALNLGISLARSAEPDKATRVLRAALKQADACAAAKGEDLHAGAEHAPAAADASADVGAEGLPEDGSLTRKERYFATNLLSRMYAEWGHLQLAVEAQRHMDKLYTGWANPAKRAETIVRCATTKGNFALSIFRVAAPLGFDRFVDLVQTGFYNDSAVYRSTPQLAQWGFGATKKKQANAMRTMRKLEDDAASGAEIDRGVLTFHGHGENSRHTSVFIARRFIPYSQSDDPMRWGENSWMRGFGRVFEGMDVVDELYRGYGEVEREGAPPGEKQGPNMLQVQVVGNSYLEKEFPKVDYIKTCWIDGLVGN